MSDSAVPGSDERQISVNRWRIWVDTGGTFTDCLAVAPGGEIRRSKVLSSGRVRGLVDPCPDRGSVSLRTEGDLPESFFVGAQLRLMAANGESYRVTRSESTTSSMILSLDRSLEVEPGTRVEIGTRMEAPLLAAHWVTRTPLREPLPPAEMRLATTRGTNALLEREGTPTVLFITKGFGDLLTIGNQQRPDLFSLSVVKPAPLYKATVEVEERLDSGGEVLCPLNLDSVGPAASALLEKGLTAAAVALLHSYQNPVHEMELAAFLVQLGFRHVSCSARLAPLIKIVPRAETAVVNAYLSGVIGEYLEAVDQAVEPGPLHVLTSAGSLVQATSYEPKDSLLSGPAGGVVGAASTATQSGWPLSLAFDMGGTSTDVSRFDGEFDYRFETRVGDARLLSPALAIETVAAGGGSICIHDGQQLKVGPQSAGADPGPACYGAGGPLTLTDVNLLLGRLRPQSFQIPIDPVAADQALSQVLESLDQGKSAPQRDELLQGFLDIANERMAEAIRGISIRQGYRPGDYALVAFGGAGGQHACALAETLEIDTVLVPADAGLLSAVGLGRARIERIAERQVLQPLSTVGKELDGVFESVTRRACEAVAEEGVPLAEIEVSRCLIFLRLSGQEASLGIHFDGEESLAEKFASVYKDHFGYLPDGGQIEVETLRVFASSKQRLIESVELDPKRRWIDSTTTHEVFVGSLWRAIPVYLRAALRPGDVFAGPALVFEDHCATVVHPDWTGEIDRCQCLVLRLGATFEETSR